MTLKNLTERATQYQDGLISTREFLGTVVGANWELSSEEGQKQSENFAMALSSVLTRAL